MTTKTRRRRRKQQTTRRLVKAPDWRAAYPDVARLVDETHDTICTEAPAAPLRTQVDAAADVIGSLPRLRFGRRRDLVVAMSYELAGIGGRLNEAALSRPDTYDTLEIADWIYSLAKRADRATDRT
ncbi:MAG: hypothetical protein R2710_31385 [Acidimicrobiales bacterium]